MPPTTRGVRSPDELEGATTASPHR